MNKSSWMMDPTSSREITSCSATDLAEIRRSSKISSWIWSINSGVVGLRTLKHPGINLYMFRATMCPLSGETYVFLRHLLLVILCGWVSFTQYNKYQVSYKYSCFSWWWAHSRPKHVKFDKYTRNKYKLNLKYSRRRPGFCPDCG